MRAGFQFHSPLERFIDTVQRWWADLDRPTDRTDDMYAYQAGALGHFVIGLAFALAPGWWPVALVALYFMAKEIRDVRSGGSPVDGAIDTAFVALGAYAAARGWVAEGAIVAMVLSTVLTWARDLTR